MTNRRDTHLLEPGPKRILALDGGGTLGIIELAFLERIESLLRTSLGEPNADFRLCDWFDLIGGTSTGAIIATCLALGMSAAEVRNKYLELGPDRFSAQPVAYSWAGPAVFDAAPLMRHARGSLFGDQVA